MRLDSETPADEEATDRGFTKATELRQEDLEEDEEEEKVCRRGSALGERSGRNRGSWKWEN